jgi:hypothetical protein
MRAGMTAQRARIESEARKLARSGQHTGWRSIERALLDQSGFTQVPYVFANEWTRSELDRLCLEARLRRSSGPKQASHEGVPKLDRSEHALRTLLASQGKRTLRRL